MTGPPAYAAAPLGDNFLWGVAASGFQSEGHSPDSNWTRYIREGKTEEPIGNSVDFRHRYRSDISLAKGLGVKVYRVGIEWARVQPTPGSFDAAAWAYYDDVINSIVAAGMRPMITIDHWVYPGWVAGRGGWNNAAITGQWLNYARSVVDRYAAKNPLWITINEPAMYLINEVRHGGLPVAASGAMVNRLITVHRNIFDYIHRTQPGAKVSSNVAYIPTAEPAIDANFLDRVADKLDFVGIDYYYSIAPSDLRAVNAATGKMWDASIAADGIYYALRHYARKFPGKPLYVVESGMATQNGKPRADGYRRGDHLADIIYWVQRARADGMPIMGYNYWSLTDNYEWGTFAPRFGLYTVDARTDPTLRRKPTDAVGVYRDIIARDGVRRDYRPTRPAQMCSLADAPSSCTEPVR
ncbi:family 1 glycosylhydrolase [Gordonia sp. CPCC 205333]|uniref:family 1 glycosylhydrolase n=1 Tax=Gordonia sp. CPCC 205333 TaxID=3140790 RepID=UPI003AF35317